MHHHTIKRTRQRQILTGPAAALLCLSLSGGAASLAQEPRTVVSVQQDRFLINGEVTHPGTAAEGLLLNSRMVQAIFDDENPSTVWRSAYPDTGIWDPERNAQEFINALPSYAARGLHAITVNLQGGSPGWSFGDQQPGVISAFGTDGSTKSAWLDRLDRVIRAADQNGIVVIVGIFYFGQDHRLENEAAIIRAVDQVTDWLVSQAYANVLVEINNEAGLYDDHGILQPARVAELITRVQQRSGGRLKVSTSLSGGVLPSDALISVSDYVLLHGNGQSASQVASMVDRVRNSSAYQAAPKPIVFNEDSTSVDNLNAAVDRRTSWGYYDQGANNYFDGFQSPPVNWTINTETKQAFFERVSALTGRSGGAPTLSDIEITSVSLIDADTDQPIGGFDGLAGGALTINLSELPTQQLTLRANTSPATVGSVRFDLNDRRAYAVENVPPYAFGGDWEGDYWPWKLAPGTYVITITPYSGSDATGTAGVALTVTLTIVEGTTE